MARISDEQLAIWEADSDLLSLLKPTDAYKLVAEVRSLRAEIEAAADGESDRGSPGLSGDAAAATPLLRPRD